MKRLAFYGRVSTEDQQDPTSSRNWAARPVPSGQSSIVSGLDNWLVQLFDDDHLEHTCEVLAGASEPDAEHEARQADLKEKIADCDQRLAKYRGALDVTDEVAPFIAWIAEVQKERRRYEDQLGHAVPGGSMSASQVRTLVRELRNVTEVLADADLSDKAELYAKLGVNLSYHQDGTVAVEALPRGVVVRVGGATRALSPRIVHPSTRSIDVLGGDLLLPAA